MALERFIGENSVTFSAVFAGLALFAINRLVKKTEIALASRNKPYPFKKGKFGIPFGEILQKARTSGSFDEIVTSGSGTPLRIRVDKRSISIHFNLVKGIYNEEFSLESWVYDAGDAHFNLFTRPEKIFGGYGRQHPDFFAGKFVDLALNWYAENGYDVKSVYQVWDPLTTYNLQFWTAIDKGKNAEKAALATRIGKKLLSHGFSEVDIDDVDKDDIVYRYRNSLDCFFKKG